MDVEGLSVKESWTEKRITPKYNEIGNGMIKIYKRHKLMSTNARKEQYVNLI